LAQYRAGLAGDFLLAQLLAFEGDVYLMPAMNPSMWSHGSTQDNVKVLKGRGIHFLGPVAGRVACGDEGVGHLIAHEEVLSLFKEESALESSEEESLRVLVSMGPMRTQLDPVRYIQNESSGLMGLALVRALVIRGVKPQLLVGPVDSEIVDALKDLVPVSALHRYRSADDYGTQLQELTPDCDIFYSASAVLDFEIETLQEKLDRRDAAFKDKLKFVPVKDFAREFSQNKRADQWLVSFSAEVSDEDQDLLSRALTKKSDKGADWTLVNRVSSQSGPAKDVSDAWIVDEEGRVEFLGEGLDKFLIAETLAQKTLEAWKLSYPEGVKKASKPLRH
jgi:phosphopantothenoylcysteine decarboxylase/phosphopantothenate--cysteine ligase